MKINVHKPNCFKDGEKGNCDNCDEGSLIMVRIYVRIASVERRMGRK